MNEPKYLLISHQEPSLHNSLVSISEIIHIADTTISRRFKHKHFIIIKEHTIYKLKWKNNPPPAIVTFN